MNKTCAKCSNEMMTEVFPSGNGLVVKNLCIQCQYGEEIPEREVLNINESSDRMQ